MIQIGVDINIGFRFRIRSSEYIVTNVQGDYYTFQDDTCIEHKYIKTVLEALLLFSNDYNIIKEEQELIPILPYCFDVS